jgi:hypothetical protein
MPFVFLQGYLNLEKFLPFLASYKENKPLLNSSWNYTAQWNLNGPKTAIVVFKFDQSESETYA